MAWGGGESRAEGRGWRLTGALCAQESLDAQEEAEAAAAAAGAREEALGKALAEGRATATSESLRAISAELRTMAEVAVPLARVDEMQALVARLEAEHAETLA